ncbi:hypothetical protein [Streptomyces cylindrosporus]|uniref:Uncharacterized protein n=1 Tax=Streptomyces cylindrosporus TaxID=2927583 RepID=A0ABS9YCU3_9ACTN|nr:hypothetical protein [Streptomyces cylindrosporus]MCI3273721.1 hypothetical protein [Streptomyces cylindrosporus]
MGRAIAAYVREVSAAEPGTRVTVLIAETQPQRVAGAEIDAAICRLRFRLL